MTCTNAIINKPFNSLMSITKLHRRLFKNAHNILKIKMCLCHTLYCFLLVSDTLIQCGGALSVFAVYCCDSASCRRLVPFHPFACTNAFEDSLNQSPVNRLTWCGLCVGGKEKAKQSQLVWSASL